MASTVIQERTYRVPPVLLIGAVLTTFGRLNAQLEHQNLAAGHIVGVVGRGFLAPKSELAVVINELGNQESRLMLYRRARKFGGDRALIGAFLASVDNLVANILRRREQEA